jgi:glyoxylase-like metal-dependent hydrolase (beta-lactamase superfamily II)
MKQSSIIAISIFFSVVQCNCFLQSQETIRDPAISNYDESELIDSLITVNEINGRTILIGFGSDAVTAINTQGGIVVIDAGIATGLSSKYKAVIERRFPGIAMKYIINTHAHPDHYGGNGAFPDAVVIGHIKGLEEIDTQWKDTTRAINRIKRIIAEYEAQMQNNLDNSDNWNQAFMQKVRYEYALADAQGSGFLSQPSVTFSDSLHLDMGDVLLELFYFGKCHSESDILIHIPEHKLLFTGDLFFKYGRPSINYTQLQDKEQWLKSIHWIQTRLPEIERVISGHGEVLSKEDLMRFTQLIIKE